MATRIRYADVEVGTDVPEQTYPVTRTDLVRYAGASGDFNPIHWSDRVATSVGLPGVIAHGMFSMAQAGRLVTGWTGDPAAVVEFGVRFSAPVVVPDDDTGTTIVVGGVVTEKRGNNEVVISITARCGAEKVLTRSTAVVRLP